MIDTKTCSRREMLAAAAAGWFALSTQDPVPEPALQARTVVFVRHAEKDESDKTDPALTERGTKRAEMLAGMFEAAGVTAVYATEFQRTQLTLAPLAAKTGLQVEAYVARHSRRFAADLGKASDAAPGGMIVVAGHSNTVPKMVAALGGKLSGLTEKGWFEDDEYERVVIVSLCGVKGQRLRAVATVDLRLKV